MLGRVFSIVQIISASAMPVAILFFGPLADVVSVEAILIVSGALLRSLGHTLPNPVSPLNKGLG